MLTCSKPVSQALQAGRPVLALESTIISHGMPWPENLETALQVEQLVRERDVVPATIAIMDGRLQAGLDQQQLELLARTGPEVLKCSRRDIPFALCNDEIGATTVAATMIVANRAGIKVFATGGIGGVHRGANESMDISADLQELSKTPVAVVCAGPKAILDIPLTLEYLETHGVPVIGYQTDVLPAFWSRDSGCRVDHRLDTTNRIAAALDTQWSMGFPSGAMIANPIPEALAIPRHKVERWVEQALKEALQRGIGGKQLTPYLLQRMAELSDGQSLSANIGLIRSNAALGADLAAALCKIQC